MLGDFIGILKQNELILWEGVQALPKSKENLCKNISRLGMEFKDLLNISIFNDFSKIEESTQQYSDKIKIYAYLRSIQVAGECIKNFSEPFRKFLDLPEKYFYNFEKIRDALSHLERRLTSKRLSMLLNNDEDMILVNCFTQLSLISEKYFNDWPGKKNQRPEEIERELEEIYNKTYEIKNIKNKSTHLNVKTLENFLSYLCDAITLEKEEQLLKTLRPVLNIKDRDNLKEEIKLILSENITISQTDFLKKINSLCLSGNKQKSIKEIYIKRKNGVDSKKIEQSLQKALDSEYTDNQKKGNDIINHIKNLEQDCEWKNVEMNLKPLLINPDKDLSLWRKYIKKLEIKVKKMVIKKSRKVLEKNQLMIL